MSNGAALEKTAKLAPAATDSSASADPLPKQPSPAARLRSAIADLTVAVDAQSPALPAMVINLRVAVDRAKKARPSANDHDRQTLDVLFHQASVVIVRASTAHLFGKRSTQLTDFTIDWDELGRELDAAIPGAGSKLTLGPQLQRDVIESIVRSPGYVNEVFNEKALEILAHWNEFCAVTQGLLMSQVLVGVLAATPEPTNSTKILALVLEGIVIAFAIHAVATAGPEAANLANAWWSKVSNAHGDSNALDDAAHTFVQLAYAIINAIGAALGAAAATGAGIRHAGEVFNRPLTPVPEPPTNGKTGQGHEPSAPGDGLSVGEGADLTPRKSARSTRDPSTGPDNVGSESPSKKPEPKPRITTPVRGIYGQTEAPRFKGFTTYDAEIVIEQDGTRVLTTYFLDANDEPVAWIQRAYDPRQRRFEMRNAFLDRLEETKVKSSDGPWLTPEGTPREAYLTLRQMKLLGMEYAGLKKVKMSTIQNIRAVIELHVAMKKNKRLSLDEAVRSTHSITYGENSIIQSGHRIVDIRVNTDGMVQDRPIGELMHHFETGGDTQPVNKTMEAANNKLIQGAVDQGVPMTRETIVNYNYDIEITVAPIDEHGGSQ